jgi:endogenous inhibitor of DNA gyrase (YacG/DUF329 family)
VRELIPLSELRGPVPRMVCPYCGKHRYWTMTSGLLTSFLTGRFITIKCRTCDKTVLWDQS